MSNTYGSDQQFIFDANARAGDPLSYQSLVMRRKIAEALAKRSPFPKTLGEGLTYAGEKFADAMDMRGLDAAERRAAQYDAAVSSRLPDANTYPSDTSTTVGTGTSTAAVPPSAGTPDPPVVPPSFATQPPRPTMPPRPRETVTPAAVRVSDAAIPPSLLQPPNDPAPSSQAPTVTQVPVRVSDAAIPPDLGDPRGGPPGGVSFANPGGNAPARFQIPIRTPEARLDLPEQPPPGRFSRAFDQLPTRNAIAQAMTPPPVLNQGGDGGGPPPVQTAALQPPGSTATDARQPSPNLNPMIPTDIAPAPRAVVAQNPVPGASPGTEPIPGPVQPYKTEINPDPGPRPRPLAEFPASILAKKALRDPMIDPSGPAATAARDVIDRQEKIRAELDRQQQAEWEYKRSTRDAQIKLKEERDYKNPERVTADLNARLAAQQAQLKIAQNPLDIKKLQGDIDNTLAEIVLKRQQAVTPKVETVEGIPYERPPGSAAGTPLTKVPGVDEPDKLTEHQQAMLQYFQTATVTAKQYNRMPGADGALTNLPASISSRVPVAGNYTIPPEWRGAKNAADSWLLAHVRNQSGAVIGRDEIPQYYGIYFPLPGDDPRELANKRERRDTLTASLYNAIGGGGAKIAADKFLATEKAKEEQRASAQQWLRDNPNDPRAADVRARLGL